MNEHIHEAYSISFEVRGLVQQYESGRRELATTIWMLLVLETWFRIYLDGMAALPCTQPVLGSVRIKAETCEFTQRCRLIRCPFSSLPRLCYQISKVDVVLNLNKIYE